MCVKRWISQQRNLKTFSTCSCADLKGGGVTCSLCARRSMGPLGHPVTWFLSFEISNKNHLSCWAINKSHFKNWINENLFLNNRTHCKIHFRWFFKINENWKPVSNDQTKTRSEFELFNSILNSSNLNSIFILKWLFEKSYKLLLLFIFC